MAVIEKSNIVDANGRDIYIARPRSQAYHGAAATGRRFPMPASGASASALLLSNATQLRNRSRQATRNNPWAWNGVESFVANCIGTGIVPGSRAELPEQRRMIHDVWDEWIHEADATGCTTFYGLQWQAALAMVESGECFLRLRERRAEDGLSVPLQLQVLEPDHVPLNKTERAPSGNIIHGGIEFDALGRRVAYHMLRNHPGSSSMLGNTNTVRIPAAQVLHVFVARRPGQIRGEPWLARVLLRLNDIDEFDDAELMRKKMAALFAGFVSVPEELASVEAISGVMATENEESIVASLEPGTMQYLLPGESVEFSNPADVGPNFQQFAEHQLRGIAAGIGVTYEQLTGDLAGVSFSSIRAGLIEFRRRCQVYIRHWICHQLCRSVYRAVIRQAVLSGALPFLLDFSRDPRPFYKVRWIPQGWEFVNPNQETDAIVKQLRAGLTSRSEEVAKRGRMPEGLDEEIADDNRRADELGLVFTSDPRQNLSTSQGARA